MNKKQQMSDFKFNRGFLVKNKYGNRHKELEDPNWLMLSTADCDVFTPQVIVDAGIKKLNENYFIYVSENDKMAAAINNWYHKKHGVNVKENELIFGNGVLHLVIAAIQAFSKPGEGVIFSVPGYATFLKHLNFEKIERQQVLNKLKYNFKINQYEIDWETLELQFADPRNKIYVLCNPHNPIGREWNEQELKKLVSLAKKHHIFIVSDEIWSDYTFKNRKHYLISFLNKDAAEHSVIISSPLKTFNMGGLQFGFAIARSEKVHQKIQHAIDTQIAYSSTNSLIYPMLICAYNDDRCYQWSKKWVEYVENNFNYLKKTVEAQTKIRFLNADATFVHLVDFSKCVKDVKELLARLNKIKIYPTQGIDQGGLEYGLYERFNLGCEFKTVQELAKRLIKEFK